MYLLNTGMFAGRRVPAKREKERPVPDKAFKVSQADHAIDSSQKETCKNLAVHRKVESIRL
jgi:hypothetical protein